LLRTSIVERDVDEAVVDVVFAGRQVEGAPVVDAETLELGLATTAVAQRLFPQQRGNVARPVGAQLSAGCAQGQRRRRSPLAVPQLERVARVTDTLRQTYVRRLKHRHTRKRAD